MANLTKRDFFDAQMNRQRDSARSSLEHAARRLASALADWDRGPTRSAVADVRSAVSAAAEGYAALEAYVAMEDVRRLIPEGEPTP